MRTEGTQSAPSATANSPGANGSTAEQATERAAATVAERLAEQPWMLPLTKAGWVAKGVVYAMIGWAAISIGLRRPGSAADAEYTGIVTVLADAWWSRILLVVIAIGLVFYIAFRVLSVLLINDNDLSGWAHRIGYLASAFTYVTVAWAAIDGAVDGRRESGRSSVEVFSADLLNNTAGRYLVGAGSLAALGIAAYFVYKGVTRRFRKHINFDDTSPRYERIVGFLGATGWIGRGAVVAAVASILFWAAVEADPEDARGLDRALQEVSVSSTAGSIGVFVAGVLLLLYALYCAVSAPRRRLAWSWHHDPERKKEMKG